jgi:hypothetical protein
VPRHEDTGVFCQFHRGDGNGAGEPAASAGCPVQGQDNVSKIRLDNGTPLSAGAPEPAGKSGGLHGISSAKRIHPAKTVLE